MRQAIPARKRLMITLHWLATGMRFKDLADAWGIGKSTAHVIQGRTAMHFPLAATGFLRALVMKKALFCKLAELAGNLPWN